MTDSKDDVIREFGLDPDSTGNRPRGWSIVDQKMSDELSAWSHIDIPVGSLAVHTRDGAANPISTDAVRIPNFIGTAEDDFDRTYRDYFYSPLAAQPKDQTHEALATRSPVLPSEEDVARVLRPFIEAAANSAIPEPWEVVSGITSQATRAILALLPPGGRDAE